MSTGHKASGPTWLGSQRPLARMVGRPVARFLAVETSGGILMVVATIAALIWANSPWSESYTTLWGTEMSIEAGSFHLSMPLSHWVNDALMPLFFFLFGLEIKRALVSGPLRAIRELTLPFIDRKLFFL